MKKIFILFFILFLWISVFSKTHDSYLGLTMQKVKNELIESDETVRVNVGKSNGQAILYAKGFSCSWVINFSSNDKCVSYSIHTSSRSLFRYLCSCFDEWYKQGETQNTWVFRKNKVSYMISTKQTMTNYNIYFQPRK